jgi:hypothetical protein
MKTPTFAPVKLSPVKFDGGLDVVTPPLELPPGFVRSALNYEVGINGGYSPIVGYERSDGRPKPSDASYAIIGATITGAYAVGNTVTGLTSGATGVIAAATATSFILTKRNATAFQNPESLQIGGITIATSTSLAIVDGATTAKLHAQYKNAAADIYRADITAVPGSGSVLGVVLYNDVQYAFRNNAGGTASVLHKSSAAGWVAVTMFYEVSFTAGNGAIPAEGAVITQGANTATVKRVVTQSGSWSGGTAAGRFIITNPAPGNFVAGAFTAGVVANCSGAATAITLAPGGRYGFVIDNFGGALGTKRVYGCDGANRGFEFDGTIYVPISTGMTTDTPSHVHVHKYQLFFSFDSSSQHSGPGTPYIWVPILGAAELAVGDTITGFAKLPGAATTSAMAIYSRNRTSVLYGNNASDWNLTVFAEEQGALAHSVQRVVGYTLVMDDRGMTAFATSQVYGNFESATISQRVNPWIKPKLNNVKASSIARDKNQYRIFFGDKSALFITFNGLKLKGMMPITLLHTVECIWSGEMLDGTEAIYFGSSDGMVYQMEKGTSLDGEDLESYIYLAWDSSKSARQKKRYKRAFFEASGDGYAEFQFRYELGYGSTEIAQPDDQSAALDFTPSYWDSFVWDGFIWDGAAISPSSLSMEGSAKNVSLILHSKSDYFSPITFSGAIIHYIPRRGLR